MRKRDDAEQTKTMYEMHRIEAPKNRKRHNEEAYGIVYITALYVPPGTTIFNGLVLLR